MKCEERENLKEKKLKAEMKREEAKIVKRNRNMKI